VSKFENQLNKIEKLVTTINQKDTEFMGINEASIFLKLKKSTLFQLVFNRKIPFYKPTKRLLFKESDLIECVEKNRYLTLQEVETNILLTKNQKAVQNG